MSEDTYRTIGAICGLIAGIGMMVGLGLVHIVWGALFGAGGAVAGGICGEKFFASRRR